MLGGEKIWPERPTVCDVATRNRVNAQLKRPKGQTQLQRKKCVDPTLRTFFVGHSHTTHFFRWAFWYTTRAMNRSHLASHLQLTTRGLIYILVLLTPLAFLPFTLEPLEMVKQTLFVVLGSAAALTWIGSMMAKGTARLSHGWINSIPILLTAAVVLPAVYSIAPYTSWIGAPMQEYTSVLTVVVGSILFYTLTQVAKDRSTNAAIHAALIFGGILVAIISTLPYIGVEWSIINPIGTPTALAVYLIVLSVFGSASLMVHEPADSLIAKGVIGLKQTIGIWIIQLTAFIFTMALNDARIWLLFILAQALLFIGYVVRAKTINNKRPLIVAAAMTLIAIPLWLTGFTPIHLELPLEVTPSAAEAQLISEQALEAHGTSYGSGPGTYNLNYARFHSGAINQTDFWNTRFSAANSFANTLTPTIGVAGVGLILLALSLFIYHALKQLVRPQEDTSWKESFVHLSAWLTLALSAWVANWNMTLIALFFIFSGLIASQITKKPKAEKLTTHKATKYTLAGVLVIGSIGLLIGIFGSTQRYIAQASFTQAVRDDRSQEELQTVVEHLDTATTLNRFNDTYYRNLADVLLLRVQEELSQVEQGDILTEESSAYIQALVAASVNAATRATELSPEHPLNWLIQGQVYRDLIALIPDASRFAIEAHQTLIGLEPKNPSHWTELGQTYLAAAKALEPLMLSSDEAMAQTSTQDNKRFLAAATESFEQAIELRPQYAQAQAQLAIAYASQGQLDAAINKLESVAKYNPTDVGVQFQLGILYLSRKQEGDIQRAKEAFIRATQLVPSYTNAHWFLASAYELEGDLVAAIRSIETVLELDPGNQLVQERHQRLLEGLAPPEELPETIE